MSNRWRNWAGNVEAHPDSFARPQKVEEVQEVVQHAARTGRQVRVIGSGHSFTPIAASDQVMLDISALSGLRGIDREKGTVNVGAGTTLEALNRLLHQEGLAMPNLGDIAYQTVAGAISTSTHGTGSRLTGLAAFVESMTLVDAAGRTLTASRQEESALFDLGRVSLGSLGVITEYTLKVTEAFRLHAMETPMKLEDVLLNINDLRDSHDHFEFFWIPHTRWALTKRNNRTELPLDPLPKVRGWIEKTFMENYAFGALCRLGRARPSLIPRLATALPSSGSREYVDDSYKIFASPRLVKFYEMEYSIPTECVVDALRDITSMVERKGYLLSFPVEVRFTAKDDVALSTSFGRDSAYIAVHVYKGMEFEPYFRDVEEILKNYAGRPHWGKIHFRTSDELRNLYPRFDEFVALRHRMDPDRVFENRYTRTVLG